MEKNTGKVREFCQSGKVGTLTLLSRPNPITDPKEAARTPLPPLKFSLISSGWPRPRENRYSSRMCTARLLMGSAQPNPQVCLQGDPPPPVNRITRRCKNITLPETSFTGGNNRIRNEFPSKTFCISTLLVQTWVNAHFIGEWRSLSGLPRVRKVWRKINSSPTLRIL